MKPVTVFASAKRDASSACTEVPMTADGGIRFEGVSVAYGRHVVLKPLDLHIAPGQVVALIGPSGSGKTTVLRALAGFVSPRQGRILVGTRDVTRLAPSARHIGMVVQSYALFPHLRVEDNVAFGLRARGAAAELVRERVPACLQRVGMASYAKRYPRELSGGQQQRVALARALAIRPQVLVLDEPLSALDTPIRHAMLDELATLHDDFPALMVLYVTHDQTEALRLADHIGIMRGGELVSFGAARQLYRHPPDRFTAAFLGQANLLPAGALRATGGHTAAVHCGAALLHGRNAHDLPEGSDCLVCIRPHDLRLLPTGADRNQLRGEVRSVVWLGAMHCIEIDVAGQPLRLQVPPLAAPPAPGTVITVHFNPDDVTLVPGAATHDR